MNRIIIDTNFLLIPSQWKVDIFSEIDRISHFNYKLFIVDVTIDELNKIIKEQRGKEKEAAKLGLLLAKAKNVGIISTEHSFNADDAIVEVCKKSDIVATQDAILKNRLREKGIPIITLRQKKYLILD